MDETCMRDLRNWAKANDNVKELWLFGSHAKDTATLASDVDIALVLMPPEGKHNWALGNVITQAVWLDFWAAGQAAGARLGGSPKLCWFGVGWPS